MMREMMSTQAKRKHSRTHLIGLIGWPTGPWPSSTLCNAAFRTLGLDWRYVPLLVPEGQLHQALLGLRALGFVGAELTAPYQHDALDYVQELTPAAETIGSVKYITVDEHGRLAGDNFGWLGFLATLRTMVPSLNGVRPLVIGSGDAARSVVYALTHQGLPLTIVAERMDEAVDLVHCLRHVQDEHSFSVYRWPQDLERVASNANLIVNATDIGRWPDVDRSPWPDNVPFPPGALVFDLVAWPNETRFLRQARAGGARTVGGLSLLVHEAALAFERWTGHSRPIDVVWRVAGEMLSQKERRDVLWWPGNTSLRQPPVSVA